MRDSKGGWLVNQKMTSNIDTIRESCGSNDRRIRVDYFGLSEG